MTTVQRILPILLFLPLSFAQASPEMVCQEISKKAAEFLPRAPQHHVDATEEVNKLDHQSDEYLEQTVINSFANIVQSFFHVVQNPDKPQAVGNGIAQMLSNIIHVAVEIMKKLPETTNEQERAAYIKILESTLNDGMKRLHTLKNQYRE